MHIHPPTGIIRRFGSIADIRLVTLHYHSRESTSIEETTKNEKIPAECNIYLSCKDTRKLNQKKGLITIINKQILNIKYITNSKETIYNSETDE